MLVLGSISSVSHADPALEGAWIMQHWINDDGSEVDAQPGLFVFTGDHYSIMFVNTPEPRPMYVGDAQTDAEKLASYDSLTANAGRYEVAGNVLKTRAYVAKDNNYMGRWPDNEATYEFKVDGDTLTLKSISFPVPFTAVLRQVEGTPDPWDSQ